MGYVDYARKRGGFGPELVPTGEVTQDMDKIRSFYSDKAGKYPDCFGDVRLKEESDPREGTTREAIQIEQPRPEGVAVEPSARGFGREP